MRRDVTKAWFRTLVASSDRCFRICLMKYRLRKALLQTAHMNAHQTMPRDCGRWFQNPRPWLIHVVPCSTVGGNPQRETPFLYRLSWVGWWTSAIQQSQSKLLGRFAVFLPSQCWRARFGELTAINNIGRTRRRARSRRLNLGLLWGVHHVKEMSTMAWRTNTVEYHLHRYGY